MVGREADVEERVKQALSPHMQTEISSMTRLTVTYCFKTQRIFLGKPLEGCFFFFYSNIIYKFIDELSFIYYPLCI